MALREGHRQMEERLKQLPNFENVTGEHSAVRQSKIIVSMFGDRLVMARTEFAGKRSEVMAVGLDTRVTEGRPELALFVVRAEKDSTRIVWLDYQVSQHALERFQQRRFGVVQRIESLVDEFFPSVLTAMQGITQVERPREEQLLPTATGALISAYSDDKDMRVGVTWIALEQLRPEQLLERDRRLSEAQSYLAQLFTIRRSGKIAGRGDRVTSWVRGPLLKQETAPLA